LPQHLRTDGETAVRESRELESGLRHPVRAPRNRRRRINDRAIAEEPMAIARSDGDPPRPRDHVGELGIEAVVQLANIAERPVREPDASDDELGLREKSLWTACWRQRGLRGIGPRRRASQSIREAKAIRLILLSEKHVRQYAKQ
jgi:hypothetical protein